MARSETLSVRLTAETRRVLAEAATSHDAAGASALARDILERWARDATAAETQSGIDKAVNYLRGHPEGWADEPDDFFPNAASDAK